MKLASKFVLSFIAVVLVSGCAISTTSDSGEVSRDEWLQAWSEVSDSVTAYVELKPSELGMTPEAGLLATESALERMKTAQLVWETLSGDEEMLLSDGKSVTAESVRNLNTTFELFVSSQENYLAALKECEIGSEDEESFNCMLEVLASDYESKGNAAYQAYYQSIQRFKQDALD
jgi:hypothetical protein